MTVYCDACGSGVATQVVTVSVQSLPIGVPGVIKSKVAQVRLCDSCMAAMGKVLKRDVEQPERVARAITGTPRVIFRGSWRGDVQAVE